MSRRRMFSTRAGASHGGASTAALAPMVDLFTLVLVALLRTWSSDPPLEVAESGFELPISREERELPRGVAIDVGVDGIYVEGWRAASSTYWLESDDVLIPDVLDNLQLRGGTQVLIRAHKDAPWALVGKVLFTSQQAGYERIELVALSRASL